MTAPLKFKNEYLYPHVIPHWAKFNPKGVAVICDDESRTWVELERRTCKVANALIAAGVKKDVKVCLFMRNSMINFEIFWGVVRSGGVLVALNPMMKGEALANMINKSDGTILFVDADELATIADIADKLANIPRDRIYVAGQEAEGWNTAEAFIEAGATTPLNIDFDPEDSFNIVYTSGSTGIPKGTELSHRARHHYTFGAGHWFGFDRDSVTLLPTQLFANGTWVTMGPCMYRGGCVVVQCKFSGEDFIRLVEKHRVTHAFLVPTMTIQILAALKPEDDMSSFRVLYTAGQPLMPQTVLDIARLLPETELWEIYGQSEGFATIMGPVERAQKPGSVGTPLVLDDIRIIDDDGVELPTGQLGEICGYSIGLMKGYYKDPENTAKATWVSPEGRTYLRSGDLGRLDEDGFLYLGGRKKDMIKSGGINIFAADLEGELTKHPAVHEAAAIGIPHPKWVETPMAFVILKQGAAVTAEEILSWTNDRLNKFQRLSAVEIVEELPRVTYGKVDKPKLRAKYWPA